MVVTSEDEIFTTQKAGVTCSRVPGRLL